MHYEHIKLTSLFIIMTFQSIEQTLFNLIEYEDCVQSNSVLKLKEINLTCL